jgi:membrane protein DedA with SNARE-associated domain
VAVHHGLYSPMLVLALFTIATAIDIAIGFYIGIKLRNKTSSTRFARYVKRQSEKYSFAKNSPKRWLTMLILGNVSFCYINAAIAGYLELPFWESQAYNFFGNVLTGIALWFAVGSVSSVFKNAFASSAIVIGLSLLLLVALRKMSVKKA